MVVGKRNNIDSGLQCIYYLFIISYSCTKRRNVQHIQLYVKNVTKMEFHVQRYSYRRL